METTEKTTLMNPNVHLSNVDMTRDTQMGDNKLPGWDNADEDEETLIDNDRTGRDLDIDSSDEWDPANVEELDRRDLEDDDETNLEIHRVKNDQFGSLARSITNEAEPDPDEIPEERESGNEELDYPDNDNMEQAKNDEVSYTEREEVTQPNTKNSTLGDVDSTFTDDTHGRTSGRLLDHEPGAGINPPEHGAYNL